MSESKVVTPEAAVGGKFEAFTLKILEAAAPHLIQAAKAEAWEEGLASGRRVEAATSRGFRTYFTNPYSGMEMEACKQPKGAGLAERRGQ